MDHPTDFLTADFLYLTLFAQKNIVIYPFILDQKLEGLKAILSVFYTVETFDVANMSG